MLAALGSDTTDEATGAACGSPGKGGPGTGGITLTLPILIPASCSGQASRCRAAVGEVRHHIVSGSEPSLISRPDFGADTPLAFAGRACEITCSSGYVRKLTSAIEPRLSPRRRMFNSATSLAPSRHVGNRHRCAPPDFRHAIDQPRRTPSHPAAESGHNFPSGMSAPIELDGPITPAGPKPRPRLGFRPDPCPPPSGWPPRARGWQAASR